MVPHNLSHIQLRENAPLDVFKGLIDGIGQVYFQIATVAGILILLGIFCAGWRFGLYAITGTAVSWSTGYLLGGAFNLLNLGIYGYNGVLTMIAVAAVFNEGRRWAVWTGVVATIISVPVAAGVSDWLVPYGLPALTMPFVLVTWIFIAARKVFAKL